MHCKVTIQGRRTSKVWRSRRLLKLSLDSCIGLKTCVVVCECYRCNAIRRELAHSNDGKHLCSVQTASVYTILEQKCFQWVCGPEKYFSSASQDFWLSYGLSKVDAALETIRCRPVVGEVDKIFPLFILFSKYHPQCPPLLVWTTIHPLLALASRPCFMLPSHHGAMAFVMYHFTHGTTFRLFNESE